MANSLKKFINYSTLSLEEKIELYNIAMEDRGCDGEFIGDLLSEEKGDDIDAFIKLYGEITYARCRNKSRYWMYGYNFYANDEDRDGFTCVKIFPVTESNINSLLDDALDEIEDIFLDELKYESVDNNVDAKTRETNINNLIDNEYKMYNEKIDFYAFLGRKSKNVYSAYNALDDIQKRIDNISDEELKEMVFELAQETIKSFIYDINAEHNIIVDDSGIPYCKDDDEQWYDDSCTGFVEQLCERFGKVTQDFVSE